jgi:hypothetical protein
MPSARDSRSASYSIRAERPDAPSARKKRWRRISWRVSPGASVTFSLGWFMRRASDTEALRPRRWSTTSVS